MYLSYKKRLGCQLEAPLPQPPEPRCLKEGEREATKAGPAVHEPCGHRCPAPGRKAEGQGRRGTGRRRWRWGCRWPEKREEIPRFWWERGWRWLPAKAQRRGRAHRHWEAQPAGTDNQKGHTAGPGRAQGTVTERKRRNRDQRARERSMKVRLAGKTEQAKPALCPGAAAAAPCGEEPPRPGASSSSWTEIVWGDGAWGLGEGQPLSLRQKDAGQHFICNHANVLAVFRIQNPCWGVPGRWVKRSFRLSGILRGRGRLGPQ